MDPKTPQAKRYLRSHQVNVVLGSWSTSLDVTEVVVPLATKGEGLNQMKHLMQHDALANPYDFLVLLSWEFLDT